MLQGFLHGYIEKIILFLETHLQIILKIVIQKVRQTIQVYLMLKADGLGGEVATAPGFNP